MIHAARKAGLVAVPLSYRFNSDEMQYVIDNSDATLVIADAEYAPLIEAARDRLPKVRTCVGFVATEARNRGPRRLAVVAGRHRRAAGRGARRRWTRRPSARR